MKKETLKLFEINQLVSNRIGKETKVLVSDEKDFFTFVDAEKVEEFKTLRFEEKPDYHFVFENEKGKDLHEYVHSIILTSELNEDLELNIIGALNGILTIDDGETITEEEINKIN